MKRYRSLYYDYKDQIYNEYKIKNGYAYVKLTQGKEMIIDKNDLKFLKGIKWYANKYGDNYYATYSFGDKKTGRFTVMFHRFLLNPLIKSKKEVDHINRNTLDNRRKNLRLVERGMNSQNAFRTPRTSMYRGVYYDKSRKKWVVQITKNCRLFFSGRFKTEEEARKAYNNNALLAFGPKAFLNKKDMKKIKENQEPEKLGGE